MYFDDLNVSKEYRLITKEAMEEENRNKHIIII